MSMMHLNNVSSISSSTPNLSLEGSRLKQGHILLGLVLMAVGLWHFYNQIKIHTTQKTFKSLPWFPTKFLRYLEPYLILISCSIYTLMEFHFAPFDRDGTFNASHIHHVEHACIAMAFFLHALFAILLDKFGPNNKPESNNIDIGHFLAGVAFGQELLLIHFHTTDHFGLEGKYHWLLQLLVSVCFIFSLLSIWSPKSFMVCYIRSIGIIFQGLWLIVIGLMLWTPEFAPKGCFLITDDHGRDVINCKDEEMLHRAKALVNILFSWVFIGMMGFSVTFYWVVSKVYEANELTSMDVKLEEGDCHSEDMQSFLYNKRVVPLDLEE